MGSTVELLLCRKEVPGSVLASVSHGEDQVAGDGDETSAWDPGEQLPVRDNRGQSGSAARLSGRQFHTFKPILYTPD